MNVTNVQFDMDRHIAESDVSLHYVNLIAISWDAFINVIYSAIDWFVPKYPTTAPAAIHESRLHCRTLRKLTRKQYDLLPYNIVKTT